MLGLASVRFSEYRGSKPSRASIGKALGGNDVKSRQRSCDRGVPGTRGEARRTHTPARARSHAGTATLVTRLCHTTFFCAITLRNSLLVSLELNTKQKTGAELYIPLGCRRRPLALRYVTRD